MSPELRLPARLLAFTVAALGAAAAYGTQRYLSVFITDGPAILAAGAIEFAYIAIAILPSREAGTREAASTAVALVLASIAFNFGHAYEHIAPGALRGNTARLEWLAAAQALVAAGFIPWIAYRLARVRAGLLERAALAQEQAEAGKAHLVAPEPPFTARLSVPPLAAVDSVPIVLVETPPPSPPPPPQEDAPPVLLEPWVKVTPELTPDMVAEAMVVKPAIPTVQPLRAIMPPPPPPDAPLIGRVRDLIKDPT